MIKVVKKEGENNQKVIGTFMKRVKKANQVNRIRKSKFAPARNAHLKKKRKALRIAKYAEEQQMEQGFGKL